MGVVVDGRGEKEEGRRGREGGGREEREALTLGLGLLRDLLLDVFGHL